MDNLGDHFGDNASLDSGVTAALLTYLTTNSAEHWDTNAANRLRKASAAEPLRITATDGWKRIHRDIPEAVFKRKSVGGKLNCASCHMDAETGRFAPRAIAIPKEKTTP
jgi:cytochrome c